MKPIPCVQAAQYYAEPPVSVIEGCRSLLSACITMRDKEAIGEVVKMPVDFWPDNKLRMIAEAIAQFESEAAAPDLTLLVALLEPKGVSRDDIMHVVETPSTCNPWRIAQEIREWHIKARYFHETRALLQRLPERSLDELRDYQSSVGALFDGSVSKRGLPLRSLRDVYGTEYGEPDWLLEGMLSSGGLSVLAAKPKVGKSTLARCLAVHVAQGEAFLGRDVRQGAVFYVSLEEHERDIQRHFRAMGASSELPIFIYCGSCPKDLLAALQIEAKKRRPNLVIVDTLFRATHVKDANDYAQVTVAMNPVLRIARETGAHVMVLHHLGKGDRPGADAILGSTAIQGTVDLSIILKRTEQYRTIETVQRQGNDLAPTVLTFDPETGCVDLGCSVREAHGQELSERILDFLKGLDEPVTEKVLQDELEGVHKKDKVAVLRKLVADGKILRRGEGRKGAPYEYSLSDSGFLVPSIGAEPAEPESKLAEKARKHWPNSGSGNNGDHVGFVSGSGTSICHPLTTTVEKEELPF